MKWVGLGGICYWYLSSYTICLQSILGGYTRCLHLTLSGDIISQVAMKTLQ